MDVFILEKLSSTTGIEGAAKTDEDSPYLSEISAKSLKNPTLADSSQ